MGIAHGAARDAEVVAHLLTGLVPEARREWDQARARVPSLRAEGQGVHDALHRQLGAVTRRLRTAKVGLPVHAACCALPDERGVLIAGPTGSGKSTLAVVLGMRLGATIISDDTVWLADGRATSIGAPIALRRGGPYWDAAQRLWYADDGGRVLVHPADLEMAPLQTGATLDLLLFPAYGTHDGEMIPAGPGEAFCRLAGALLRRCTAEELDDLAELTARLPAAVVRYADVDSSVDACRQFFSDAAAVKPVRPTRLDDGDIQRAGLCRDVRGIRFDREVALWRPPMGQVLCVRNWPRGTLWETPAAGALAANGFLERKEP